MRSKSIYLVISKNSTLCWQGDSVVMISGHLLGGIRAESDNVLRKAFVKTYDFNAITNTKDFNFIVGRRGTGKSALSLMSSLHIQENKLGYVYENIPEDYEQLELVSVLGEISEDYSVLRAIMKVSWRVSILFDQLEQLIGGRNEHYKFKSCSQQEYLQEYYNNHSSLHGKSVFLKTILIIRQIQKSEKLPLRIAGKIATEFDLSQLKRSMESLLEKVNKNTYYYFDGLDEGWQPNSIATAILGGLALCASEILESSSRMHLVLFIRDNMFRSLCYFDADSSRHIEGNTLRLNWDEDSLLHIIANRLRVVKPELKDIESDIKVWNRFAQGELKNKDGFKSCLAYTLFRPRDIIVLLNTTFSNFARSGREHIISDDIESSSKQISKNRLDDLLKEYDVVFPGLKHLITVFDGQPAFMTYAERVSFLSEEICSSQYDSIEHSDYAVLGSGKQAFFALFSIGFLGVEESKSLSLHFCHDGSTSNNDDIQTDQRSCIHPCYWKELNIQAEEIENSIKIEIYDDNVPDAGQIADLRFKRVGQIISSLPNIKAGREDASVFEDWVFQSIKLLFAGKLSNPELKANKDSIQQRDVVATNSAPSGFWKRIYDDYGVRQVVFEVKNFEKLNQDVFRQALSYSGKHYGKLIIVVYRTKNEGLTDAEKGWVKEYWNHESKVLVFLLPDTMLSRFIKKIRTTTRHDYADKQLCKRLDTYERSYLSLKHNIRRSRKNN